MHKAARFKVTAAVPDLFLNLPTNGPNTAWCAKKKKEKSVLTSHRGHYDDFAQSTSPPCLFIIVIIVVIIVINLALIKALWFITLIHLHSTQWVFSFYSSLLSQFDHNFSRALTQQWETVRVPQWHWTLDFYRNLFLSLCGFQPGWSDSEKLSPPILTPDLVALAVGSNFKRAPWYSVRNKK